MPDGSTTVGGRWNDIGVHPTPLLLVRAFARAVSATAAARFRRGESIRILDACAGDGRLGHAVARRLARLGYQPHLTLVEVDQSRFMQVDGTYAVAHVVGSFFDFSPEDVFDVVVSNPPYLALTQSVSRRFGLDWHEVIGGGKNLYGLALRKCLDICAKPGTVGFLAPHGWLRNASCRGLRAVVDSLVSQIDVYASSSRRLFPNVNQDTAVQIFTLREVQDDAATTRIRISYDRSVLVDLAPQAALGPRMPAAPRVRIGPFVWNREKCMLALRPTRLPVIYGGNITSEGDIDLDVVRYRSRQYLLARDTPEAYVSTGPCLVIKRSLRGCPGRWRLDSAYVPLGMRFVAENHVIVVEFGQSVSSSSIRDLCSRALVVVEQEHRHHGHPNVSVGIVRHAMSLAAFAGRE